MAVLPGAAAEEEVIPAAAAVMGPMAAAAADHIIMALTNLIQLAIIPDMAK
jgi:hypothetical protein